MRLRKRHAWSAVLIGLFVLPVLKPEGFPGLEGGLDSAINWYAKSDLGNPHSWRAGPPAQGEDSSQAKDLREQLGTLREEYFTTVEQLRQGHELSAALARIPRGVPARIERSHDANSVRRSIVIGRGSEDGVVEGAAVVRGWVLLGTVQQVQKHSARVRLLTDPHARLEVALRTVEGERATGYIAPGEADTLRIRSLQAREGLLVRPDDPVFTSAKNPNVPAGLLVGRVVRTNSADAGSFVDVSIRPLIDLERSTTVLVLLPGE
jgi:cell shape-determining protein MreC